MEQQIRQWYQELCASLRKAVNAEAETLCVNCKRSKKEHYSGKCSLFVASSNFLPINAAEVRRQEVTTKLLEQLALVNGWNL